MVANCFVKCQVCGSITRVRLQVGFLEKHPIVFACGECGTALNGTVEIGQDSPRLFFQFKNADIIDDCPATDYLVECSGEFPTSKPHAEKDAHRIDLSPFMRCVERMGKDRYERFSETISKLNSFNEKWTLFKRIFDLYQQNDRKYLFNEIWKVLPKEQFPCRNELEIARAVHTLEITYFIGTLRKDILTDRTLSESIFKLDKNQIASFLVFLGSNPGYSISELRASIYKVYNEFFSVYQYLIPALSLQYCREGSVDYEKEGSTTSSFDLIKQFSLNTYETLGNLLVVPVALNGIKYFNDYSQCTKADGGSLSIKDFLGLSKAKRYHYCDESKLYTKELRVILNSHLRNAIGHNDVEYDTVSQKITYVPNPKDRSKKQTTYLLEFENEAIRLFQAITVVSEYLYRLNEIDMMLDGQVPLPLEFKRDPDKKVGGNDSCPCGSGKKYKNCHGL